MSANSNTLNEILIAQIIKMKGLFAASMNMPNTESVEDWASEILKRHGQQGETSTASSATARAGNIDTIKLNDESNKKDMEILNALSSFSKRIQQLIGMQAEPIKPESSFFKMKELREEELNKRKSSGEPSRLSMEIFEKEIAQYNHISIDDFRKMSASYDSASKDFITANANPEQTEAWNKYCEMRNAALKSNLKKEDERNRDPHSKVIASDKAAAINAAWEKFNNAQDAYSKLLLNQHHQAWKKYYEEMEAYTKTTGYLYQEAMHSLLGSGKKEKLMQFLDKHNDIATFMRENINTLIGANTSFLIFGEQQRAHRRKHYESLITDHKKQEEQQRLKKRQKPSESNPQKGNLRHHKKQNDKLESSRDHLVSARDQIIRDLDGYRDSYDTHEENARALFVLEAARKKIAATPSIKTIVDVKTAADDPALSELTSQIKSTANKSWEDATQSILPSKTISALLSSSDWQSVFQKKIDSIDEIQGYLRVMKMQDIKNKKTDKSKKILKSFKNDLLKLTAQPHVNQLLLTFSADLQKKLASFIPGWSANASADQVAAKKLIPTADALKKQAVQNQDECYKIFKDEKLAKAIPDEDWDIILSTHIKNNPDFGISLLSDTTDPMLSARVTKLKLTFEAIEEAFSKMQSSQSNKAPASSAATSDPYVANDDVTIIYNRRAKPMTAAGAPAPDQHDSKKTTPIKPKNK